MSDPFRFINSILKTKEYQMETQYDEKEYSSIFTNIALSQHIDTILHANELNQLYQILSPKMHYDYLFHSIRQMKRPFRKWAKKKDEDETIAILMEYYQVNKIRAKEYLNLLNKEELESILIDSEKGTTTS